MIKPKMTAAAHAANDNGPGAASYNAALARLAALLARHSVTMLPAAANDNRSPEERW